MNTYKELMNEAGDALDKGKGFFSRAALDFNGKSVIMSYVSTKFLFGERSIVSVQISDEKGKVFVDNEPYAQLEYNNKHKCWLLSNESSEVDISVDYKATGGGFRGFSHFGNAIVEAISCY